MKTCKRLILKTFERITINYAHCLFKIIYRKLNISKGFSITLTSVREEEFVPTIGYRIELGGNRGKR